MKEEIDKRLSDKNIRITNMRQMVLQMMMKQKSAISLAELEAKFDRVDKSTLFRTLKTFEEKKLIHSIDDGTGSLKYAICKDLCTIDHEDFHVHFLCTICKNTFCLDEIQIPSVTLPPNFSLESVNMIVKGVCSDCKK